MSLHCCCCYTLAVFAVRWSVEVELLLEKALKIKFKIAVNMLDYTQAFWIIHKRCKIIKFKLIFIMNFKNVLVAFCLVIDVQRQR